MNNCKMTNKPPLQLADRNGNAFAILARAHKATKQAGWNSDRWEAFRKEAISSNYDHLLVVCGKYFEVF